MQGKEKLWILAIVAALLFAFAFIGIPVGLGAFLFFNFALFSLYYIAKHSDQNAALPKSREAQMVLWIFGFFYVLLTLPYLYRMDPLVTVNVMIYHFLFIMFMMLVVCFPALLHILDPFMGFIYGVI